MFLFIITQQQLSQFISPNIGFIELEEINFKMKAVKGIDVNHDFLKVVY